ncbi:unnamed protein product, partial [Symbiodinium sp. CCMP2456]
RLHHHPRVPLKARRRLRTGRRNDHLPIRLQRRGFGRLCGSRSLRFRDGAELRTPHHKLRCRTPLLRCGLQ